MISFDESCGMWHVTVTVGGFRNERWFWTRQAAEHWLAQRTK